MFRRYEKKSVTDRTKKKILGDDWLTFGLYNEGNHQATREPHAAGARQLRS